MMKYYEEGEIPSDYLSLTHGKDKPIQFEFLARLGEGSYGEVILVRTLDTKEIFAIKRIRVRDLGTGYFPISAYRELHCHMNIAHDNLVKFFDFHIESTALCIWMEYAQHDLATLIEHNPKGVDLLYAKKIIIDILSGLQAMHDYGVMHRDIKPGNILIDGRGICKICDFGLSRPFARDRNGCYVDTLEYTHQISSRWYRAPEILFGARKYGPAVDMWAVGCILIELLTGMPFCKGGSDIEQLVLVVQAIGTIREAEYPEAANLPDYEKICFDPILPKEWTELVPAAAGAPDLVDFLEKLMIWNPTRRMTATDALSHRFLYSDKEAAIKCNPLNLISKSTNRAPGNTATGRTEPTLLHRVTEQLFQS